MKKILIAAMTVVLVAITLMGCQTSEKIQYERVNYEDLNSQIQNHIEANKNKSGHLLIKDKDSHDYYVVVFAGEKTSGGYDIKIKEVTNDNDNINVMVTETALEKGQMVAAVITYPMDIVRIKGTVKDIKVIHSK